MRRWLLWVPLALFLVVLGVAVNGLVAPSDPAVRSALVGQTLPRFTLPPIARGKPGLSSADFGKGEPRLLNIFASWCLPCAAEAPQLLALRDAGVTIDAIAVRDHLPVAEAGRRTGIVFLFGAAAMGFGSWMGGYLFDLTGSYTLPFLIGVGFNLLNLTIVAVLISRLGPFPSRRPS